ncbi:type II secretion system protein GspM [Methyloferula stellata]|uniref:type II secretion system protein GspM n=1 Tax=Methyloferula stellata TaxID=876270 RepID=UPI000377D3C1|nr:type II secretion system protein GspM [Methyloferula stellata]
MPKIDREQTVAVALLLLLLVTAIAVPALSLTTRSNAQQELADAQNVFARVEAAHQRLGTKGRTGDAMTAAPSSAFFEAQTSGLASAQFEAYLAQVAADQQASLVSSAVQPITHTDTQDVVRIQAALGIGYDALQELLYKLETGTPYVFVDSLVLQSPNAANAHAASAPMMKVTLNLRALWHQTAR